MTSDNKPAVAQTVIAGTDDPSETIPALLGFLESFRPGLVDALRKDPAYEAAFAWLACRGDDVSAADELADFLVFVLRDLSPAGFLFGIRKGSDTTYGYWPDAEIEQDRKEISIPEFRVRIYRAGSTDAAPLTTYTVVEPSPKEAAHTALVWAQSDLRGNPEEFEAEVEGN